MPSKEQQDELIRKCGGCKSTPQEFIEGLLVQYSKQQVVTTLARLAQSAAEAKLASPASIVVGEVVRCAQVAALRPALKLAVGAS